MAPTRDLRAEPDGHILEHPAEAFAAVPRRRRRGSVVCEEKHMGSRAVALVCRDADVARERFGVPEGRHRRAATPVPDGRSSTTQRSPRRSSAGCAPPSPTRGCGTSSDTDWLLLDAELMPWSLKASGLLRTQYAAVGAASGAVFPAAIAASGGGGGRGVDVGELLGTAA